MGQANAKEAQAQKSYNVGKRKKRLKPLFGGKRPISPSRTKPVMVVNFKSPGESVGCTTPTSFYRNNLILLNAQAEASEKTSPKGQPAASRSGGECGFFKVRSPATPPPRIEGAGHEPRSASGNKRAGEKDQAGRCKRSCTGGQNVQSSLMARLNANASLMTFDNLVRQSSLRTYLRRISSSTDERYEFGHV